MSTLLRHTYTSLTITRDCHIQYILHTNDCIGLNKEIHLPDCLWCKPVVLWWVVAFKWVIGPFWVGRGCVHVSLCVSVCFCVSVSVCVSLSVCLFLCLCLSDVNTTYPQALAGNPESYSGFVPLSHAFVSHFHSLLGPSVTQCNMSPAEKHTKENEKLVQNLTDYDNEFQMCPYFIPLKHKWFQQYKVPYHHHQPQRGHGKALCSFPWCLLGHKVAVPLEVALTRHFVLQLNAVELLFIWIQQKNRCHAQGLHICQVNSNTLYYFN